MGRFLRHNEARSYLHSRQSENLAVVYIRTVLEPVLVPLLASMLREVRMDNYSRRQCFWTQRAFESLPGLNGIEILEWPAQSPDLNPIEMVWREIETELGEIWGRASDVAALKLYIENTWRHHITEEMLDRLVDSMPARLQAVIDAGGNPTPY